MLDKISSKLADNLIRHLTDNTTDIHVYIYAIQLLLSTSINIITIIAISCILKQSFSAVLYFLSFAPLRIYTGGYHSNTYFKCFLVTIITYCIVLSLKIAFWKIIPIYFLLFLLATSSCIIIYAAPVIHPNHPLSPKRKKLCSRKIKIVLTIENMISLALLYIDKEKGCMVIFYICLVSIMLIISFILNREQKEVNHEFNS